MTDIVLVTFKVQHVSSREEVDAVDLNMIDYLSILDSTIPKVTYHFGAKLLLQAAWFSSEVIITGDRNALINAFKRLHHDISSLVKKDVCKL